MDEDENRYHPTKATYEGQLIAFAGGLRRYKHGKVIAYVWLLGGALVFLAIAVSVATSL